MDKLTAEQESMIGDDAYHEKKLREEEEKENKKHSKIVGRIPIDPDRFDQILERIGWKKVNGGKKI